MWKTINGLGKQVVWYSEEEYQAIKKLNEANKGLLTATAKQNYQLLQEYDKLKTENDELKIYIESNEQQVKEVEMLVMDNDRLTNELNQLKETNESLLSIQYKLADSNTKLRQTLTEIKEILQANKEELNECLYNDIDGQILQKIGEAEND